jgi:putative salt-induced outer membrane protein YdiY
MVRGSFVATGADALSDQDGCMSADVIDIGSGYRLLRGPERELERQRTIGIRRVSAFRRAIDGTYHKADRAMFGSVDRILTEGPGQDPRLVGRPGGPSAA